MFAKDPSRECDVAEMFVSSNRACTRIVKLVYLVQGRPD